MEKFEFLNCYQDSACVFDKDNNIIFKNNICSKSFSDITSFDKFKKRFNFYLSFLSAENIANLTPIDLLLQSNENFHTKCTYQNKNNEYISYYIYTFKYEGLKVAVFRDISAVERAESAEERYNQVKKKYDDISSSAEKLSKLQEQAQTQVLKLGIINRISLVIRETNDIEKILNSALNEINNLLGSFKTYFSIKDKGFFKVVYSVNKEDVISDVLCSYESEIIEQIKNKKISVTPCLKECLNSSDILPKGVKRIIIPIHNKNKLLGIIVSFTRQNVYIEDNLEILQSISVQLASSIIQAGLIQQLNKKNKKLEKTLSELKNTQMQLISSEKMASIGQLAAGVAHEINTPLASICSNNLLIQKLLLKDFDTNKVEMLKELNSIDIEAANRISGIVKSLRQFVRLDEAEFQEADINNELDSTLKLITHETKNNIEIEKHYSKLPPVLCSVNKLNQVFMNLLVNSCHSIQEKKEKGKIIITTYVDNNNLIVKISDNGTGIPSSIQNKIFSAGFTTKKVGIGTGLGLSISKKIVEMHKGTISFVSKENEGAEFTVSIPVNL